jgi:hypothetical protein
VGLVKPAQRSWSQNSGKQLAMLMIGVAAVARLPGNSRTHQHVIMVGLVLAAVAGLGRDSQTRSRERLVAWDQRRHQRYMRTVKAQAKKLGDGVTG